MTSNTSNSNSSQEPEARDEYLEAEIQGVKGIIKNFEKAEKGFVLYPAQSEIVQGFVDELVESFDSHLSEFPLVELSISSKELTCKGKIVYEAEDRSKSLAFRFFQSGLRKLVFHSGLTRDEILEFLDILKQVQKVDRTEDDVVTLLWERDCPHISYMTIDYFSDEDSQEAVKKLLEGRTDPQQAASKIVRYISSSSLAEEVDDSLIPEEEEEHKIEEDLYALQPEELEALREKINWEKDYNPLFDFNSVIFKIIQEDLPESEFTELAEVVTDIIKVMISKGNFEDAADSVEKLKEFHENAELPSERREYIWEQIKEVSSQDCVRDSGIYLAKAKKEEEIQAICDFLKTLHTSALVSICNLFKEVDDCPELLDTLDEITEDNHNILLTKLHDSNHKIIMAMLKVLGRKDNPKIVREVLPLLNHKDPDIRLQAVETLSNFKSSKIQTRLIDMIDDPNLTVKKAVLNQLIQMGVPGMFAPLLEIVEQKEFIDRDFFEKKALLIALGLSDPERAFPILVKFLKKRNWFFKKDAQEETRQCAALALGETRKVEAVEILQKFASDDSTELSKACLLALKKLMGK